MITDALPGVQIPLQLGRVGQHDFDSFESGPNREACEAVRRLAATGQGGPVYLWGPPGRGKSHLLLAACASAASLDRRSAYVPLSRVDELSTEYLDGLAGFDLICVDDVHAVAGNEVWELALFNLYNELRDSRGSLAVSSRFSAKAEGIVLRDLQTRLGWGLVYHLQELTDEQKINALQRKADSRGFQLPQEVATYLMSRTRRDMDALCDCLDRLDQASLSAQRRLTVPFVRTLLENGK